MNTAELNQSLLAALKALVSDLELNTVNDERREMDHLRTSFRYDKRVCFVTTFNNAKYAIEAAEKELQ